MADDSDSTAQRTALLTRPLGPGALIAVLGSLFVAFLLWVHFLAADDITSLPAQSISAPPFEPQAAQHVHSGKPVAKKVAKHEPTIKHAATVAVADNDGPRYRELTEDSVEYKFATIDHGSPVEVNGPESQHVAQLLDEMEQKFKQSRERMCDIVVECHNIMVSKGVTDEGVEAIMQHLYESVPDSAVRKIGKFNLEGVAATYVVMRTGDSGG